MVTGCAGTRSSCDCSEQKTVKKIEPDSAQLSTLPERRSSQQKVESRIPESPPEKMKSLPEEPVSTITPVFPEECKVEAAPLPSTIHHRSWREIGTIRVGESHLDTVDVSPDETLLLVMSSNEGAVRIYDLERKKLIGKYGMYSKGSFERGQAMFWQGSDEKQMFIFGSEKGIHLYDAQTGELLNRLTEQPCWEMRWSDDHSFLVTNLPNISTQSSEIVFYKVTNARSLAETKRYSFQNRVDGWDLSCGNRLLAATFYPTNDLRLYDLNSEQKPQPIWKTAAPEFSNDVDISPRGDLVAVGGDRMLLLDIQDPSRHSIFEKYNNNIDTVRFHPDGTAIVTTSYDSQVQVLEPVLGKPSVRRLKRLKHKGRANVYGIVFYGSGTRMATSSGDRTIKLWGYPQKLPAH